MSGLTFDDFSEEDMFDKKTQPQFQFAEVGTKEKLLKWLVNDLENKLQAAESRFRTYRENMALFKGIHYRSMETRGQDFRRDSGDRSIRSPKIVINFVQEMVEAKVAKRSRYKPSIAVIPNNDEIHDKNNAKSAKKFIDNRWSEVDIDEKLSKLDKLAFCYGEGYIKVDWDPDEGDTHPLWKKMKEQGMDVPILDEKGKPTKNKLEEEVKVGDVVYKVYSPDKIFLQLSKDDFSNVDEYTLIEYVQLEEAKKRWPDKAEQIKESNREFRYDTASMQERRLENELIVQYFYHRPTKWLPKGKMVVATKDVLLEVRDYPYDHGELNILRMTDIDVPNEIWGRSFIMNIRQLQRHFNNITSGIARNHGIASAPKWMMPKGSCNISNLNNDITITEYSGPVAPQLVQSSPTSPEIFAYQDKLEKYIEKQSTIYGISRGEPPRGIKAAVALQFLDEQEQERETHGIAKRYSLIRNLAKMSLALMGQHYDESDGRTLRILGEDNSFYIKSFAQADFSSAYDVKIQNSSALPDSKAARIQSIIDLNMSSQTDPIFSKEQIIQMLDLATDDVFKDRATVGVKAAESIWQSLMEGEEVPEPQPYDDLLVHYEIFMTKLQERTFKEEVPQEIKDHLIQRIKTIEGLMYIRAMKNPVFMQKLLMKDDFPVFFEPPKEAPLMPPTPPEAPKKSGADTTRVKGDSLAMPPKQPSPEGEIQ